MSEHIECYVRDCPNERFYDGLCAHHLNELEVYYNNPTAPVANSHKDGTSVIFKEN